MKQFVVDAFTDKVFSGNQAAVCVLEKFLPDDLMLKIAKENNFSETAFAVKDGEKYNLRWFTPKTEIDFCGHATLATSFVILEYYEKTSPSVTFQTLRGEFIVKRSEKFFEMNFPVYNYKRVPVTEKMTEVLGVEPIDAILSRDLLMILDDEEKIINLKPNLEKISELDGKIQAVTARGKNFDCVSRVFAPKLGISEDPVTGSTHCLIAPYWAEKLGKKKLSAFQASERSGNLLCEVDGDRVKISGQAVLFSIADLKI